MRQIPSDFYVYFQPATRLVAEFSILAFTKLKDIDNKNFFNFFYSKNAKMKCSFI